MFERQTVQIKTHGQWTRIHLVSTGAVSVKTKFREARKRGYLAMIDFMLDKTFTEWMPIWVMIIEHPEGIFLVDTGENADVNNPGYFKSSGMFANWFDTTQFKFKVEKQDEIGPQLNALGIPIEKITAVILTHLHLDHIDGLKYFPSTPVIVNRKEWEHPYGDLPKLYPSWFKPQLVDLDEQFDLFEHAYYLTESRDLLLAETPGHTPHHCSVVLRGDDCTVFFAADVCYSHYQLLEEKYSGANASFKMSKDTYDKVRQFAKKQRLVFLPSHDKDASTRLRELKSLFDN
jgi:glyoxylase-like metal-dependent hydrolase (beta-lactamase superfamily II)